MVGYDGLYSDFNLSDIPAPFRKPDYERARLNKKSLPHGKFKEGSFNPEDENMVFMLLLLFLALEGEGGEIS